MSTIKLLSQMFPEFRNVEYVICATEFERLKLRNELSRNGSTWSQTARGFNTTIKFLKIKGANVPITLSFIFVMIDGVKVAFYRAISDLVIESEVTGFFKKTFPGTDDAGRWRHLDCEEFSSILSNGELMRKAS